MHLGSVTVCLLWSAMSGCGTDISEGDPPVEEAPLSPAPPDGGQQLASSTYRLQPGEEKYMCYQFYSPDNAVGITRVEGLSQMGVHHIALFQAFGRDEAPEPHECGEVLLKQTWLPIWASGASAVSLELPKGAGFIIQPGTQYIVQLHLQNSGDAPLDIRAGVNLAYEHDTASLQPAGMYAFGTFDLMVPANTRDHQVPINNCTTGKHMNVFAAFPHMHKYGKRLEITRAIGGGAPSMFYEIDPWTFGDQPMEPMQVAVGPDDRFDMTCHYDNMTGQNIPYGESSDEEMCFLVLFYYPYDGLAGCINGS